LSIRKERLRQSRDDKNGWKEAMMQKPAIILICFLSLIFISLGEVFPEIPHDIHNLAETNHNNGNSFGEHFYGSAGRIQDLNQISSVSSKDSGSLSSTQPQQTGFNLANTNDASSVENYNVDALSSGMKFGSLSVGENPNYRFGYNGNSYTINFFNINYGELFEKRPLESLIGPNRDCNTQDLKNALKRLAEKRGIQEMEQKENLQLLKQIALG
jgi:hypothetical protein